MTTSLGDDGGAANALDEYVYAMFDTQDRQGLESIYRLFFEKTDIDTDLCELRFKFPFWLYFVSDEIAWVCLKEAQATAYSSWPTDLRMEIGMRVFNMTIYLHREPQRILYWIGESKVTRAIAEYKRNDGFTLLHLVIEVLRRFKDESLDAALDLIASLISHGAEISSIWRGKTPFLRFLEERSRGRPSCCRYHLVFALRADTYLWYDVLRRSGTPFLRFVRGENLAMKHCNTTVYRFSSEEKVAVDRLTLTADSSKWDLEVHSTCCVPIYERRSAPGAWPHSDKDVSKICWKPSYRYEDATDWVESDRLILEGRTWSLEKESLQPWKATHDARSLGCQDDHGVIALRVDRQQRPLSLQRSCSFSGVIGDSLFQACDESRRWLPYYQRCPRDGKFQFYDGERDTRACLRGACGLDLSIQETRKWQTFSFVGQYVKRFRERWLKRRPPTLDESCFLTDDGRWVSTKSWKTICRA